MIRLGGNKIDLLKQFEAARFSLFPIECTSEYYVRENIKNSLNDLGAKRLFAIIDSMQAFIASPLFYESKEFWFSDNPSDHLYNRSDFINRLSRYRTAAINFIGYERIKNYERRKVQNKKLRSLIFSRDGYKCRFCGSKEKLSIDHIIPKYHAAAFGLFDYSESDYQTLCCSCNSKKSRKLINV